MSGSKEIRIELVNEDSIQVQRVVPVRFARHTKGPAKAKTPDFDDRSFRPGTGGHAHGPSVGMTAGSTIQVEVIRDRAPLDIPLHASTADATVARVVNATISETHKFVELSAPAGSKVSKKTKLLLHHKSASGPLLAEMEIHVHPLLKVPIKYHACSVQWKDWKNGKKTIQWTLPTIKTDGYLKETNVIYAPAGIQFVQQGKIHSSTMALETPRYQRKMAPGRVRRARKRLTKQLKAEWKNRLSVMRFLLNNQYRNGLITKPAAMRQVNRARRKMVARYRKRFQSTSRWLYQRIPPRQWVKCYFKKMFRACGKSRNALNLYFVPLIKPGQYGQGINIFAVKKKRNHRYFPQPHVAVIMSYWPSLAQGTKDYFDPGTGAVGSGHEIAHVLGVRHYGGGENARGARVRLFEDLWSHRNLMTYMLTLHRPLRNKSHNSGVCRATRSRAKVGYEYAYLQNGTSKMGTALIQGSFLGMKKFPSLLQSDQISILRRSVQRRVYVPVPNRRRTPFFAPQWRNVYL